MYPENLVEITAIDFFEEFVIVVVILNVNTHSAVIVGNPVFSQSGEIINVDNTLRDRFFEPGFSDKCYINAVTMDKLLRPILERKT